MILTVGIIVAFSFVYRIHYQRLLNQYEKELTKEQDARTQGNVENYYYIKERDGYVIVYEADHIFFNSSTLIQISGRVGRKLKAPTGKVYFLSKTLTKEMKECIKEIKKKNSA